MRYWLRWRIRLIPALLALAPGLHAKVPDSIPQSAEPYPTEYFRLPLDLPVALSGTFGELRSN
ncbi:MAG TPA: hypothetical protein VD772_03880, partial [Anseongella sp.]|nr:hypothetical protein [Anseongella sp.]